MSVLVSKNVAIDGCLYVPVRSGLYSTRGEIDWLAKNVDEVIDYYNMALSRVIEQFKNKANFLGMLKCNILSMQDLQKVYVEIKTLCVLSKATGAQLDVFGLMVGLPRDGRDDTNYRYAIKSQITILSSYGCAETVLTGLQFMTGANHIHIQELGVHSGHIQLFTNGSFISKDIANIMDGVAACGCTIVYVATSKGQTPFSFSNDDRLSHHSGTGGFSETPRLAVYVWETGLPILLSCTNVVRSNDGKYEYITRNDLLYKSSNYGELHTFVTLGLLINQLVCSESGQYVAFTTSRNTGDGKIHVSKDFGVTWTIPVFPVSPYYFDFFGIAISSDGGVLYAGGGIQYDATYVGLWRSIDFGVTWARIVTTLPFYGYVSPLGIGCSEDGSIAGFTTCISSLTYCKVYKSIDFGVSWYAVNIDAAWYSVLSMSRDGKYWAVLGLDFSDYKIWRSSDYGENFVPVMTSDDIAGVYISKTGQYWLVTKNHDQPLISNDYGETFVQVDDVAFSGKTHLQMGAITPDGTRITIMSQTQGAIRANPPHTVNIVYGAFTEGNFKK